MKIINNILASFNTFEKGFSARKLTAFSLMVCIAYIHYKFVDTSIAIEALIVDLCGVLLCLGLVTASHIISLKNGGTNENNQN